jgi:hypothetical protein
MEDMYMPDNFGRSKSADPASGSRFKARGPVCAVTSQSDDAAIVSVNSKTKKKVQMMAESWKRVKQKTRIKKVRSDIGI